MNDYGDDRGRDRGDDFDRRARDEGDREERGGWRGEVWERARARVSAPGGALQIYGMISVFLAVVFGGIYAIKPDIFAKPVHDLQVDMAKKQPQGAQPI